METSLGRLLTIDMVHPLEYELEPEIQRNGIYVAITQFLSNIKMRSVNVAYQTLNGYRVTGKTAPRVYNLYRKALKRLDCKQEYPLYIYYSYGIKAQAYGTDNRGYVIIMNSECLDMLTDDELLALLGQQLGHILTYHVEYFEFIEMMRFGMEKIPVVGRLMGEKLISFFAKWKIAAAYTADRAGAFVANNIYAQISLMCKQLGVTREELEYELNSCVDIEVPNPGTYFMWLSHDTETFGMVERVRELIKWSESEGMYKRYPYLYYCAMIQRKGVQKDDELMLLHKRAMNGNVIACGKLGEMYLLGQNGLPPAFDTGKSLLTEAAFAGDGRAMYFLAVCFGKGIEPFERDEAVSKNLMHAARSRGLKVQILPRKAGLESLGDFCSLFAKKYPKCEECLVNCEKIGEALPESDEIEDIRNSFWMESDAEVFAVQSEIIGGERYGLALSKTGIYGRLKGEEHPFFMDWVEFNQGEVTRKSFSNELYICCNDKKIVRCGEDIKNSIAEVLVRIKTSK